MFWQHRVSKWLVDGILCTFICRCIVVQLCGMTDRIDLDDQLFIQFSQSHGISCVEHQYRQRAKEHLKSLDGRSANGIIFTVMFKFANVERKLSERKNIVVMADEAHRGQYGLMKKIVMSENENGERRIL